MDQVHALATTRNGGGMSVGQLWQPPCIGGPEMNMYGLPLYSTFGRGNSGIHNHKQGCLKPYTCSYLHAYGIDMV